MYKYEEIKKLHLELTERCQAACPMCPRTGNKLLSNSELSIQDVRNIFPKDFVKQLEHITLCGNFGEPIVAKDCIEIIEYFKYTNPKISIGINTNAGARNSDFWIDLASILDDGVSFVVFGIDGLEDTNHLYRVGVNWNKIISSAKTFISRGGNARWDFIAFEHNEHQVQQAEKLSVQLGFKEFRLKKTYRFKYEKFKNLKIKPSKLYFNENNNLPNHNEYFDNIEIDCHVKNLKEIYVSAQGLIFPCCWVAGQIYNTFASPTDYYIDKDKINLKNYSIKEIMNTEYFFDLERRWKINSINEGKPKVCAHFCAKNNKLPQSQINVIN
jgi:MoaA/NifB/PqqE/SkfB family radical SAM enzyme